MFNESPIDKYNLNKTLNEQERKETKFVPKQLIDALLNSCLAEDILRGETKAFRFLIDHLQATGGEVGFAGSATFSGIAAAPHIFCSSGVIRDTSKIKEIVDFFYNSWNGRATGHFQVKVVIKDNLHFVCGSIALSKTRILGVVLQSAPKKEGWNLAALEFFLKLLVISFKHLDDSNIPFIDNSVEIKKFPVDYVEGYSELMASLHQEVYIFSKSDFPILILGETGVGKEHIAKLVHLWSGRREESFVAINCAAIPSELLEAEMFGIGNGVATGVKERNGYFGLAENGTLFLDEIGELPQALQAKFLRVLEAKEYRQIGGKLFNTNVRIIAATNINLHDRIEKGEFRRDLYFRLAGFELLVPPLRERIDDLPLLIEHFINIFSKEAGKKINGISPETLELLRQYSWTGNIRELAHELKRLVYLCPPGQTIKSDALSSRIARGEIGINNKMNLPNTLFIESAVNRTERRLILEALGQSQNNRTKAAKLLGITRNGLAIKMKRLGIENQQLTP